MKPIPRALRLPAILVLAAAALSLGGAGALFGTCGPFTDTANDTFCAGVLEIFTFGITTGTTATTYSPGDNVTRLQMAAFLSRTVDGVLKRANSRAIAGRFWSPKDAPNLGLTALTTFAGPRLVSSDGADIWVTIDNLNLVSRVRASDGKLLETWTGANTPFGVLTAIGKVFVTGDVDPGLLYRIDPSQPAGGVTTVAVLVGRFPKLLAYDGSRIWTGNAGGGVSLVTPGQSLPWSATTVTVGLLPNVRGIVYDGANIWISGLTGGALGNIRKLDSSGAALQSVTVGMYPGQLVFDGTNLWVPNRDSGTISVVRASSGVVLATLTGNGLAEGGPEAAAFDGQRVLVTTGGLATASLWKAADLSPLGSFSTGAVTDPFGVCSDGLNFWIALTLGNSIARF